MQTQIFQKIVYACIFLIFHCLGHAQLKSFGSNSKYPITSRYKMSVYAYYDLSRESGIGYNYVLGPRWSADLSVFTIRPNEHQKNFIQEWDYYDFSGVGICAKMLMNVGAHNFYLGTPIQFEYLEHKKKPVEYYDHSLENGYINQEECYGWAFTSGVTFGKKFLFGRLRIDPFANLNVTIASLIRTTFSSQPPYKPNYQYPYKEQVIQPYLNLGLGIKVGLEFFRNKKNEAIDLKFDMEYIPRQAQLEKYINELDIPHLANPKPSLKARNKIKKSNKRFIKLYYYHYKDTSTLYNRIEAYYKEIDSLIELGKR